MLPLALARRAWGWAISYVGGDIRAFVHRDGLGSVTARASHEPHVGDTDILSFIVLWHAARNATPPYRSSLGAVHLWSWKSEFFCTQNTVI